MPEIGTSGSMSGDGKRSVGHRPQATAPILDSTTADIGATDLHRLLPQSFFQADDSAGLSMLDSDQTGWVTTRCKGRALNFSTSCLELRALWLVLRSPMRWSFTFSAWVRS